jgi:hypothetical protein
MRTSSKSDVEKEKNWGPSVPDALAQLGSYTVPE